ncbi:MAG: hypothetical protein AAF598_05415 [Bacteroidota bacterium]
MESIEQLLKQLENDVKRFEPILQKAALAVQDQNVSSYPIFVAHQGEVQMGIALIDRETQQSAWSFHLSTLEEFATKGIVTGDRLDDFKKVYKKPNLFMCFLVLVDGEAKFVFYPYTNPDVDNS